MDNTGKRKIYAKNLIKIYGKRTVVNDLSMDMTQGEVVGILGPNGAGKTTTFYMIPQHFTQRLVQQVGGRVVAHDASARQ